MKPLNGGGKRFQSHLQILSISSKHTLIFISHIYMKVLIIKRTLLFCSIFFRLSLCWLQYSTKIGPLHIASAKAMIWIASSRSLRPLILNIHKIWNSLFPSERISCPNISFITGLESKTKIILWHHTTTRRPQQHAGTIQDLSWNTLNVFVPHY